MIEVLAMSELSLLEKLVLEEIGGKNRAIHAYDRMMWTVRTGFLTLFFAGWGILLKALVEKPSSHCCHNRLAYTLFIFSIVV